MLRAPPNWGLFRPSRDQTNQRTRQSIDETVVRLRATIRSSGRTFRYAGSARCARLELEPRFRPTVNDALPLRARTARHVTCHQCCRLRRSLRCIAAGNDGGTPERHTGTVEGLRLEEIPARSIADVLQTEAHKLGADVLVAGPFGHPKLCEKLMGGVTHDLLANMKLPVLMSYCSCPIEHLRFAPS
jgi:hypothetical protein